jgi:meiotic recombination protein SPO11
MSSKLKLQVLTLTDGDPAGFQVLCAYKYGSANVAYVGEMTTPNIYWLGVRPSDSEVYKILEKCKRPLTAKEVGGFSKMKDMPFSRDT